MRRLVGAVLACVVVVGVACGLLLWIVYPRSGVTPDNGDRIHAGMTRQQVEVILGKPPDEGGRVDRSPGQMPTDESGWGWRGDGGSIWVFFNASETVTEVWIHGPGGWPNMRPAGYGSGWPDGTGNAELSLLQRFRRWLGW